MPLVEVELLANHLGYDDAEDMFKDLYVTQGLSMSQISRRLGLGPATVNNWLRKLGISTRSRGGANRSSVLHYKLHLMDQRYVFTKSNAFLADILRMNPSYVYKYKLKVVGSKFDQEAAQHALRTDSSVVGSSEVPFRAKGVDGSGSRN